VFADETGVYSPECELLETPEETGRRDWTVRRFSADKCTFINSVLSDNEFHTDKPAWFADKLPSLAETYGQDLSDIIALFTSPDPLDRAEAWRMVGEYFGYDNLDSYPIYFTQEEISARWAAYN